MNLPFGLPIVREYSVKKREGAMESTALYERKLAEYRDTLENYKRCILQYSGKLDSYDKNQIDNRSMDNQLSIVQTALDITYIKEQEDKIYELLEDIKTGPMNKSLTNLENVIATIVETNFKLEGLDKNVVNRLSELLLELQRQNVFQYKQLQTEQASGFEKLTKSVKKGNALLWFVFVFNIVGLSALAFLVLYIMEIIPF